MKFIKRFLLLVFCAIPCVAGAQIATTAGSNLTAWNGNSGATNNNNWNTMMNSRTLATANMPTADFGNCNSLILRCAQPKCAGCTTMDLARSIVAGCVNSNANCKQYGNDLIEYISAQIVAGANSKMQEQQLMAQQAAAQQAAAQNSAQMQQMQEQMMQMQMQMQEQNAAQMAQMQAALEEQKALAAQAQSEALAAQQAQHDAAAAQQAAAEQAASQTVSGRELTAAQRIAAESGVSEDLLARQTISGEILTGVENAELQLKKLYATMQEAFTYAGCDKRGNNCKGPKRVKVFKDKAQQFFQPYDDIVDEMYDALELSLAVGVDITDVIMMLNGSCNRWGKYMCRPDKHAEKGSVFAREYATYTKKDCVNEKSVAGGEDSVVRGGQACRVGMVVPPQDDVRCILTSIVEDGGDDIERQWVMEDEEDDGLVRLGCATSALDTLAIFGRRSNKKTSAVTLDVLERILLQDAPEYSSNNRFRHGNNNESLVVERTKYCGVTEEGYNNLVSALNTKKLPREVCISDKKLSGMAINGAMRARGFMGSGLLDSRVIPAGYDSKSCATWDSYAKTVDISCGADWSEEDERCYLRGNCKLDNGNIQKVTSANELLDSDRITQNNLIEQKKEYEKRDNHIDTNVDFSKVDQEFDEQQKADTAECVRTGGKYNGNSLFFEYCNCGTDSYNPDTHKCEKGKVTLDLTGVKQGERIEKIREDSERQCSEAGGVYNGSIFVDFCDCGNKSFDPRKSKCEKGNVVKK